MTVPVSNMTATFANTSYRYDAIGMDANTFGQAANSTLINLKANGNSKFTVDIYGNTQANGNVIVIGSATAANAYIAGNSVSNRVVANAANITTVNAISIFTSSCKVNGQDVLTSVTVDPDTLYADTADVLTAGFSATPYNAGTKSSGTFTPNPDSGNFQYATNGGAHTLAPPTNACTIIVLYTNSGAGTITTSGFTMVTGDSFTTTAGHEFMCYITKHNNGTGFSHLHVVALQ